MNRAAKAQALRDALAERIVVLDGAMGTMIQQHKFGEAEYRGERFKDHTSDLKGANDLLVLTQPDVIRQIHLDYLRAGAEILETNTFNANSISMEDYNLVPLTREVNREAARLAREAADIVAAETGSVRWVAGALGPTNRTASLSPDVENPGYRNVSFSGLVDAYREAAEGLLEGGADLLMVETIFDTLNAKADSLGVQGIEDGLNHEEVSTAL